MATSYPGTLDVFTNPVGTNTLDDPDHANQHADANDAIEAIQAVVGTTAGTNVLSPFSAGEFPARVNTGGTIVQTLTGGTINSSTLGTPTVTGGGFSAITIGTSTMTGGTANDVTLGTPTIITPTIQNFDGWQDANETWTYAGADDPTYTFTIASFDATAKYSAGMRIKLTQTTAKYFIITKVTFDDPGSTITIYGGTDYDLASATITSPYYSSMKAPQGFPLDPDKWTVETTSTLSVSQASPTASTWYNLGSLSIDIPIGCWSVYYSVLGECSYASGGGIAQYITLSSANNTELSKLYTTMLSVTTSISHYSSRDKDLGIITFLAKDTYYLNSRTGGQAVDTIYFRGDLATTIIRAVCAYL